MKKIGLLIFILALIVGVCLTNMFSFGKITGNFFNFSIHHSVSGSGHLVTERRDVTNFKSIKVGGVFEVEAKAGKEFSLEIEADDNLLPLIKTDVTGETLRLETEKRISSQNPIRVRITAPDLESLDVSGASKVSVVDVNSENLTIDASGASKVSVAGQTENLIVDVSGAGKILADSLKAENVSVDASGASNVEVFAVSELRTDASGASNIIYQGSPKNLIKKTSGASSVRQK